ncbi:exported hypothetical protein [Candidatus Zixiibacteriota bacterium]|nr:exported hypothetical protein [candidate division Zixibacteria bacterium]
MCLKLGRIALWTASVLIGGWCVTATGAVAQVSARLGIRIDSVAGYPGEQQLRIPVYLTDLGDSVAAFKLNIFIEQPDIMIFNGTGMEMIDTSGTLISGWPTIQAHSLSGTGHDLSIVAMASSVPPGTRVPCIGFPPPPDIPLIKLVANNYDIPDTTTDRSAMIFINLNTDNVQFSTEDGLLIGVKLAAVCDTSWFRCDAWLPPPPDSICLQWSRVSGPPADSIIIDTSYVTVIDTELVTIIPGAMTIHPCGDANGNGFVNILDISHLINSLYRGGAAPVLRETADANGDGIVNIIDVSFLISYLYRSGPVPRYI